MVIDRGPLDVYLPPPGDRIGKDAERRDAVIAAQTAQGHEMSDEQDGAEDEGNSCE
ncbi:hypothetical protein [Streptomyces griseoluteus]|uniref:hypothetical protein n=1 Tax=Streptomyces griseoluteus TaxID=29306 RepID=UPI00382FAFFE